MDSQLNFDWESLTFDEVDLLEEMTGRSIEEMTQPGRMAGKLTRALAFVVLRRTNPDLTIEELGKMPFSGVLDSRLLKPNPTDPSV